MHVTAKADYAVRAVVELVGSGPDSPRTVDSVAKAQGIPISFLLNILRTSGALCGGAHHQNTASRSQTSPRAIVSAAIYASAARPPRTCAGPASARAAAGNGAGRPY